MTWKNVRPHIAPGYLLVCLLLGGSSQTIWLNAPLQLAAVIILGWALIQGSAQIIPREAKFLAILVAAGLGLVAFQLAPLPPVLWQALPGRKMVAGGLSLLSLQPSWQPLSLAPYNTISTALAVLPPLAMLGSIIVLRAFTRAGLAVALLIGSALGVCLGVFQVGASEATAARFYLQPEYDGGTASGFFANPNHMATLLLLSLPFLAALVASGLKSTVVSRRSVVLLLGVVGTILFAVGLLLNGSLAGFGLAGPVLLLSGLMVVKLPRRVARVAFIAAGFGAVFYLAVFATPLSRTVFHGTKIASISTRQEFFRTGIKVARDYFPVGSGVGTFPSVYRIKEDPRTIDPSVFVNHAHDDYLELLIETGLPGIILVISFLAWWLLSTVRLIRTPSVDRFALAGAIGAATIFVHSFVDYPVRTSAVAASLAMCFSLMALPKSRTSSEQDFRTTRHVEIH